MAIGAAGSFASALSDSSLRTDARSASDNAGGVFLALKVGAAWSAVVQQRCKEEESEEEEAEGEVLSTMFDRAVVEGSASSSSDGARNAVLTRRLGTH